MFNREYKLIEINKIKVNPDQPRATFSPEKINELAKSIKENGLIQPLVVRAVGKDQYQIIAGERRYRACKEAKITKIPCIVKAVDSNVVDMLALVENIQREDLNVIEEARAYKNILTNYDLSQTELARKIGKSQATIANRIRLLSLGEDVKVALKGNQITERHARALLKLNKEGQVVVLRQVLKNNLNVNETEKLVTLYLGTAKDKKRKNKPINKTLTQDIKIAVNTVKQAAKLIRKSGVKIKQEEEETDDAYIIKVILKK